MKKYMFMFLIIGFYSFSAVKIPRIEQVEGLKPWWLSNHRSVEGVLEGVGIVSKKNSSTYRTEALELAKVEIAGIKNTYIDSTLLLEQNNNTNNLNISTKGTTSAQVNGIIIDTYEDESDYYVWVAEFYNDNSRNDFVNFINEKNRETLENKLEYLKYLNKTVITNKKRSKITLNNSDNKTFQKNEILNIYRLTESNINPMTKELNDFSKEKVGEAVVEEVFDNQVLASADILSTFRIKEGDIAVSSGKIKEEKIKEETKEKKISKLQTLYNYNLNYEPQVFYVERSKLLGPRQYELSLMSDFNDKSDMNFKVGILRFVEGTATLDMSNNSSLNAMIKVAFPILKNVNVGMAYKKDLDNQSSYAIGLLEYSFYENAGFLNLNITSPIGNNNEDEIFGVSAQIKPDKDVLLGAEYSTEVNNNHNDMTILKLNLKMIENTWIGGGVIFDDERTYFLKISNIAIY
ncbi:MAG: hypothetical protein KBE24_08060 [Fusobacteriaceae bacterium]|nr:hypothetical protein [Fusobacteriaceae bacterium]MBP9596707.1 hypothetical protein [Fusobacteriaceae bacterium]